MVYPSGDGLLVERQSSYVAHICSGRAPRVVAGRCVTSSAAKLFILQPEDGQTISNLDLHVRVPFRNVFDTPYYFRHCCRGLVASQPWAVLVNLLATTSSSDE
jgi:hypothetical protein